MPAASAATERARDRTHSASTSSEDGAASSRSQTSVTARPSRGLMAATSGISFIPFVCLPWLAVLVVKTTRKAAYGLLGGALRTVVRSDPELDAAVCAELMERFALAGVVECGVDREPGGVDAEALFRAGVSVVVVGPCPAEPESAAGD